MRLLAKKPVAKYRLDYSTTNLPDTATWIQVVAATSQASSAIEIFNGSGTTLRISTGSPGNELLGEIPYFVLPGGSSILLPWEVIRGARISIRAVDIAPVAQGSFVINLFG